MSDEVRQIPRTSKEVIEMMEDYVKAFATIYLTCLKEYKDRLEKRERKPGKLSDLMGEVTGALSGGHEIQSDEWKATSMVGLQVFQYAASAAGTSYNRKRLKKLLNVLMYCDKNPHETRLTLVRCAMQIFQSYEAQFVPTTSDGRWERAMHKLAEDAVDRSLNYFREHPQEEFSVRNVKKGIVTGTSKTYRNISTGTPKLRSGHTVTNEHLGRSWNTSDIYQKTGIVDDNVYFYTDKKGAKEFGYRLRLDVDDFEGYLRGDVDNAHHYEYVLSLDEDEWGKLEQKLVRDVEEENKEMLEKLEDILKEIRERIERIDDERSTHPTTGILFQIRKPLRTFSGRTKQLDDIDEILRDGTNKILVISGLSGVGKTELTVKYLNEFGKNFDDNIVWINAEKEETMRNSLYDPATKMELNILDRSEREKSLRLILCEVYEYFVKRKVKSLFVFDNVENYDSVKHFLPNFPKGVIEPQIIIISTNSEWEDDRHSLKVYRLNNFEMEESMNFFKNVLKIEDDSQDADIKKLAKNQHNFPLTLHEAVSYIREQRKKIGSKNFSVTNYIQRYEEKTKDLLDSTILKKYNNEYDKNTYTALHLSLSKIESEKMPQALEILNILAYFSSDQVDEGLFLNIPEEDDVTSVIQLLENYSIITRDENGITIHGLIQQVLRIDMEENTETKKEHLEKALNLLKNVMTDRETAKTYSSHITSVWIEASKYFELIEKFIVEDLDATHSKFIHFIAESSDTEIFEGIIGKITELCPKKLEIISNVRDNDGWTPLHLAAKNGQYKIVETLLDNNAEIDPETKFKFTPLHLAALNRYPAIVKLLISRKSKLNMKNKHGYTPLHFAVRKNDLETVKHILSEPEGVMTLQVEDDKRLRPLSLAVKFANFSIVKLLIDKGAKIDARCVGGSIPLHFAAQRGDLPILELLLEINDSVDETDDRGYTSLHFAVKKHRYDITKLLLSHRANINAVTKYGLTPLHFAIKFPNIEFVDLLLNNGANVNVQNIDGFTPLHLAVESREKDIVNTLMKRPEIRVNLQTSQGNTPLHLAAEKGNLKIVEILMNHGASNDYENVHRKRPSDVTRNKGVCDYIVSQNRCDKRQSTKVD